MRKSLVTKKPCVECGQPSFTLYCDMCCGGGSTARWETTGVENRKNCSLYDSLHTIHARATRPSKAGS